MTTNAREKVASLQASEMSLHAHLLGASGSGNREPASLQPASRTLIGDACGPSSCCGLPVGLLTPRVDHLILHDRSQMTRPFDAAYVIVQTLFVGDASEEMQITLLILLVVKLQQEKKYYSIALDTAFA